MDSFGAAGLDDPTSRPCAKARLAHKWGFTLVIWRAFTFTPVSNDGAGTVSVN
jgi:hypothetical protein